MKIKDKKILDVYYHIDNGGFTFEGKAINNGDGKGGWYFGGLEISHNFYGYVSQTTVLNFGGMNSKNGIKYLKDLGAKLINAAEQLENLNK